MQITEGDENQNETKRNEALVLISLKTIHHLYVKIQKRTPRNDCISKMPQKKYNMLFIIEEHWENGITTLKLEPTLWSH